MIKTGQVHNIIRIAGVVTGLVIVQQLIIKSLFGLAFDWAVIPQLALVNFGVVFAWMYFSNPDKRLLALVTLVAAFCCAVWLRAVLFYIGVFRFIAPLVVSFIERQVALIVAFVSMPQFIPAMFAAVILLLLMPRVKAVYNRLFTSRF